MFTLLILLSTALAHPPEEGDLDSLVVVKLPFPSARPPGDDPICFQVAPTLQTPDTVLDENGLTITCSSTEEHTELCLEVAPTAPWPERLGAIVCEGNGHTLKATFQPGHDPADDPSDGVVVVRARGPLFLEPARTAVFAAPGWPDATGVMEGGSCAVEDGVLTLEYDEPLWRSRLTCSLGGPRPREVPVRIVQRQRASRTDDDSQLVSPDP